MSKLVFALLAAAALTATGCNKKKSDGTGEALAKMRELKDEMCKCKDAKCAQDVSDKMTKWSQEQSKNQKEPPKMSEEDQKKAAAIGEEMGKCMQTAMSAAGAGGSAEGSAAAPPAGGEAPPAGGSAAPAPAPEGSAAPAPEKK